MRRRQLVELLYQESPSEKEIEDKVLSQTNVMECKDKLPEKDGEYLVRHMVYGWCIFGYTVAHKWGVGEEIQTKKGEKLNKVTHWAELEFLEK